MDNKNYYEILGLTESDKKLEQSKFAKILKSCWKNKCKENHPDKNQDDPKATEKLQKINEAYSVLSDPNKRELYDRFGEDLGKNQGQGGGGFNGVDLEDIFNQHFNGFGRPHYDPRQNSNLRITVSLTFEELYKFEGINKKFTYKRNIGCNHCNSTGLGKDGKKIPCPTCKGQGIVNQQMGHNMFMQIACPSCQGSKYKIDKPCTHCNEGFTQSTETIDVNITPGSVFNQMVIPQKGNEMMYNGQKHTGDLIIQITPSQHKEFQMDQQGNLHIETDVNILDCVMGGNILFKCIDGTEKQFKLKIGTRDKEQFRMSGLGIAKNGTERTSLYVHINHKFPTEINQKEIEILNDLKTKQNFK